MGKGHILRLGLGAMMLAAVGVVMAPHITHHVSRNAVVNAPVLVIVAPFDGRFVSKPLMPGMAAIAGRPALELEAAAGMRLERVQLVAERARLDGEIDALEREIEALELIDAALERQGLEARDLVAEVLALQLDAALAEMRAAAARAEQATTEAERRRRLVERGTLAQAEADLQLLAVTVARADLDRLEADAARLRLERGAALDGAAGDFALGDGSYARQRRDEVAIRRADLVSRRESRLAAKAALDDVVAGFGDTAESFERFRPVLDGDMVAWTASPGYGAAVGTGSEVIRFVDCSRRFIEVPISENAFESLKVGDVAEVRLKASSVPLQARVAAIRGAGSMPERGHLAAAPLEVAHGMLSVLLDLPPVDLSGGDGAARFCDVGRTAQVKLDRELPALVARAVQEMHEATSALVTLATTRDWLDPLLTTQEPDDA